MRLIILFSFLFFAHVPGQAAQSLNALPLKILFLGDSLTDGYGVHPEQSYPSVVGAMLKKELGLSAEIINGSESGSTSKSAMQRLRWFAKTAPDILVLALGANDGLRGIQPAQTRLNLNEAILYAKKNKMKVVLAGMKMPPNYGPHHTAEFAQVFSALAEQHQLPFVSFLLEGVAGIPQFNQGDMIHPNALGHAKMAQNVFLVLKKLL